MTPNEYQQQAARTLIEKPDFTLTDEEVRILWNAIGLAGEAGETCEVIKKAVFHRHPLTTDKLVKELGDVCWYLAALCTVLGLRLEDVMAENIAKLRARYPEGWDAERSKLHVKACPVASRRPDRFEVWATIRRDVPLSSGTYGVCLWGTQDEAISGCEPDERVGLVRVEVLEVLD